jgi:hypothetical protein
MNGLYDIKPIKSIKVTSHHLVLALAHDLGGARISTMPDNIEGNKDYGLGFQLLKIGEILNIDDLPEKWQIIIKAMNSECWRIGYTLIHSPNPILCGYPDLPMCGFFCAPKEIDLENINAKDLIHTAGQFIEYDTNDKGIWQEWIKENIGNADALIKPSVKTGNEMADCFDKIIDEGEE